MTAQTGNLIRWRFELSDGEHIIVLERRAVTAQRAVHVDARLLAQTEYHVDADQVIHLAVAGCECDICPISYEYFQYFLRLNDRGVVPPFFPEGAAETLLRPTDPPPMDQLMRPAGSIEAPIDSLLRPAE